MAFQTGDRLLTHPVNNMIMRKKRYDKEIGKNFQDVPLFLVDLVSLYATRQLLVFAVLSKYLFLSYEP